MTAWSKACLYTPSFPGIALSNPVGAWMSVFSILCCQVEVEPDHGILPSVCVSN